MSIKRETRPAVKSVAAKPCSVTVEVTALSHDGMGIGFLANGPGRGKTVFIAGALPGETVNCRITEDKGSYARAVATGIIAQNREYIAPHCPHGDQCGGCALMRMPYADQLRWKENIARSAMTRIGKFDMEELAGIWQLPIPSPALADFRNKVELAFGYESGKIILGFRKGDSHTVFPLVSCALMDADAHGLIASAADLANFLFASQRQGLLRSLVLRKAATPDSPILQWHVILLTEPRADKRLVRQFAQKLRDGFPKLGLFVHEERKSKLKLAQGEKRLFCIGPDGKPTDSAILVTRLGGRDFRHDIASFFQVNTQAAEKLASLAQEFDRETDGLLLDMYCGVGAPGLLLKHEEGLGIEADDRAIRCARENARDLPRWTYHKGDAAKLPIPDNSWGAVLLDPPRAGLSRHCLNALERLSSRHIIYISCNPATLARDAATLNRRWELRKFASVDMFPHTPHLECCTLWQIRA